MRPMIVGRVKPQKIFLGNVFLQCALNSLIFLANQTMKNAWNKIMGLIGVAMIGMTALEVVWATVSIL